MTRTLFIAFLFLQLVELTLAQKPFDCGAAYLSVGQTTFTRIYKLEISGNQVLPSLYTSIPGLNLNGFGFRRQDRMMYALNSDKNPDETTSIYRIDGDGNSKLLAKLPFDPSYSYFAADVSPDGRYYTVLANGNSPAIFYVVDLLSATLAYKTIVIRGRDISAPDIAYSVNGDKLFVEDENTKSLLEIDLDNARVQASYPSVYFGSLLFSGLFGFDCALFGYVKSSNSFIRIETVGKTQPIGVAKRLNTVNFLQTAGIDACACPQTVKFEKTASKIISKDTCSRDYKFVFQFDNECNTDQKNVDFSDKFPGDFLIKKIERQPFGGTMSGGPGNRDIAIKGMNIPSVKDSIVIIAALAENYKDSLYKNQALLKNLVYPDGTLYTQVSDNPYTIKSNDSTSVKAPINVQFDRDTVSICQNGEIKLKPRAQGTNLQYQWNTGAVSAALSVDKPGNYRVTVTSDCFSKVDSILVIDSPLRVNIGPDLTILPGDSVLFKPDYKSYNPIKTSIWNANSGALLTCKNCFNNVVRIRADETTVKLKLTDEQGCIAEDEVLINTRRKIYIPNAFSPNDDGYNDYFFINTEYDATLVQFEIYNRWGDKIFQRRELCKSNTQACSWDGKFKGLDQNPGTYTYRAIVDFGDGVHYDYKGEILLVRD